MVEVFSQRVTLGLIQCPDFTGKEAATEKALASNKPEFIVLVADHDPEKSTLLGQLQDLEQMSSTTTLPFDIKIATANGMGYGLFLPCIYGLSDYLKLFAKQIH